MTITMHVIAYMLVCAACGALGAGGAYLIMMRRFDEWIKWRLGVGRP